MRIKKSMHLQNNIREPLSLTGYLAGDSSSVNDNESFDGADDEEDFENKLKEIF